MFSQNFQNAAKKGMAYTWTNATYDYTALDTVLMVCNDHTGGWSLNIERIDMSGDASTQVYIHAPAYASWSGTEVIGVNQDSDNSEIAKATAVSNEVGQSDRGSVYYGGSILADHNCHLHLNVRLGYHKAIAVDFVTVGTEVLVTIWGYYSM